MVNASHIVFRRPVAPLQRTTFIQLRDKLQFANRAFPMLLSEQSRVLKFRKTIPGFQFNPSFPLPLSSRISSASFTRVFAGQLPVVVLVVILHPKSITTLYTAPRSRSSLRDMPILARLTGEIRRPAQAQRFFPLRTFRGQDTKLRFPPRFPARRITE